LREADWRLERFLSDNGNEFKGGFSKTVGQLKAEHTRIRAGRPQTNGNVESLHRTILDECWRPSFARYLHPALTSLRRDLEEYLRFYNFDRVHHGSDGPPVRLLGEIGRSVHILVFSLVASYT